MPRTNLNDNAPRPPAGTLPDDERPADARADTAPRSGEGAAEPGAEAARPEGERPRYTDPGHARRRRTLRSLRRRRNSKRFSTGGNNA